MDTAREKQRTFLQTCRSGRRHGASPSISKAAVDKFMVGWLLPSKRTFNRHPPSSVQRFMPILPARATWNSMLRNRFIDL